jgi:small-conductance mechanosensitive channel
MAATSAPPSAPATAAETAPAAAKAKDGNGSDLIERAGEDLLGLPEQAEELTRELYHWLRADSLGALSAVGLGVLLYGVLLFARGRARRRLSRAAVFGSWGWVALRVVSRTRSFFLVMVSARAVAAMFGAPGTWTSLIGFLFTIAAAVQGAFWVREFLLALVERKAGGEAADPGISSAVGVLTVIINVVVWSIAAIILLDNLGVNVTGLMAGLGIGGIAIGLAAQGIFSDLFAALSILLDKPFKRGDTIQVGQAGFVGTVEHIGLKTTRFRALSGEVIVMSNANLLSQQINNFADFAHRRVVLLVQVIYQTDPTLLARIPAEMERIVGAVPGARFDRAHLFQFAASALDYELVFFVDSGDLRDMFDARQAVMIELVKRFAELGVDFAFPAQVSYMAGPDGRIVDPHHEDGSAARPAALGGGAVARARRAPAGG